VVRAGHAGRLRRRQLLALAAAAPLASGLTRSAHAATPSWDATIPLWRWGQVWPRLGEWQGLGFTGSVLGAFRDPPDAGQAARVRQALDQAGRLGHALGLYLHPLNSQKFGQAGSADPTDRAVVAHAMATLAGWMDAVGDHPALAHMLLNSEFSGRTRRAQDAAARLTAEMARAAKQRRAGLLTWTDPWRDAPVRVPPGIDCLGSWTYPQPHPLRQWIVPFLRAGAGPGRKVMQTVSLWMATRWSARAEESGSWRILPPDPAAMALWLAFAQAPDIISVYAPSTANPFADPPQDPATFSPGTWTALKSAHASAVVPFGPVLSACRPMRPRTALLLSADSVLAVPTAARAPGWDGELAWPWAAMLVMQGFPFDVLLDEDFSGTNQAGRYEAVVVPFASRLPEAARRSLAGHRVIDRPFDAAFLRGVDGALANRVGAADAASRLARLSDELGRLLPASSRLARHDPDLAVGHHDGGAVSWHVAVNLALSGPPGATFRERGVARETTLSLRVPQGTVLFEALARKPLAVRLADGFAEVRLALPAAGGAVIAALPGEPGPPRLERTATGAVLQAPFAGVMAYDLALGGGTRRIATGRDGTHRLAGRGRLVASCALTGQSAALDI